MATLREQRERWLEAECRRGEGLILLELHQLQREVAAHERHVNELIAAGRRRRLGPSREELELEAWSRGLRALTRALFPKERKR